MKIDYTKQELIEEWLAKFPDDKENPDLEQMALAGYVKRPDDTYYWASFCPHLKLLDDRLAGTNEQTRR